jgi:hypothetical protein
MIWLLLGCLVGAVCANFLYQGFRAQPSYREAFERSFFQASYALCVIVFLWWIRKP